MELFEFGPFRMDSLNCELLHGDERVPLTPRAFDVLLALVQQAGQIVDKETLLRQVWPGTFVAEPTLTQNVYTVRKALAGLDPDTEFIETVPRRGYRFAVPVKRSPITDAAANPTAGIRSLAVLPFAPLAASAASAVDALDPFLGLGMADALITRLSEMEPTTVRPTSAVMKIADTHPEPVAAGRALGVDAILEGRLQSVGELLRVTVQLVLVRDASILWAESFDVVFTDLLAVQDEITARVSGTLELKLRPRDGAASEARPFTRNVAAHQAYVKGRYYWNQRSAKGLTRAVAQFEEALRHDERYALAHSGLADSYALLPLYGVENPKEVFPKSKQAVQRALECDEANAEAHTSAAYVKLFWDWNWEEAEASFRRALELNPGYSTAHHWFAFLHSCRGRHDEAVASGMLALELEPLSLVINSDLGLLLYFARRYDDAAGQFRVALELNPDFAYARFGLALALAQSGRAEDAVDESKRAVELSGNGGAMLAALGYAYALAGRRDEAVAVVRRLEAAADPRHRQADRLALVWCGLGHAPRTVRQLTLACEERSRFVVFLNVWPAFDPVRSDPGFVDLVRKVGL